MEPTSHPKVPPDLVPYLLPGERVINIEEVPPPPLTRSPSALRELYRLGQVEPKSELYELSPPLASLAIGAASSPELHRYETLFARDALRVAMDLISIFPKLARTTLLKLASFQGTEFYAGREEEPGRIPHEMRDSNDQVAKQLSTGLGWEWPYYGSIDATPEFIRLLATYYHRSRGREDFLRQNYINKNGRTCNMKDALINAVEWLLYRTNSNPEGLLESKTTLPHGIENQVWKDSWDAYFHKDGAMANHDQGVASIEAQRLVYDALLDCSYLYAKVLHISDKAAELRAAAERIRQTILTRFWIPNQGGYFALGSDRDHNHALRQLKVRTSNMGHLLHSRILVGDDPQLDVMRKSIIRQLFSAEMLTPNGIRTLASDEVRFRPGAYHNGSVWLWDTYIIIKGLRRHNYFALAELLGNRLLAIADTTHAFPEFVRGDNSKIPAVNTRVVDVWDTTYQRVNRIEQPPQQVQAWSVATILALKHYKRRKLTLPEPDAFEKGILQQIIE